MKKIFTNAIDKIVDNLHKVYESKIPAHMLCNIVTDNNIILKEKKLSHMPQTKGAIRKKENQTIIGINTYRENTYAQNLTLAHEIGHYYIWKDDYLRTYIDDKKLEEEMVWYFTYEFLIPKEDYYVYFGSSAFDYTTLMAISGRYNVSKFASGYRYTQLTDKCCAIIQIEDNKIKYYGSSKSFKKFNIEIGKIIPDNTLTRDVMINNNKMKGFEKVSIGNWFNQNYENISLYEFTCAKNEHMALTLLEIFES